MKCGVQLIITLSIPLQLLQQCGLPLEDVQRGTGDVELMGTLQFCNPVNLKLCKRMSM